MLLKISLTLLAMLVIFLIFVAIRPNHFDYKVTEQINAPVEKVFPYLSDFRMGVQWSPFEKEDPEMKKEFIGGTNVVGAKYNFEGKKNPSSGTLEILKIVPNERVEFRLTMNSPIKTDNFVVYEIKPKDGGSEFTWSMSGENTFVTKLMSVFFDCRDMFREGIKNLKVLVE